MIRLNFKNSQRAWIGINQFFLNESRAIIEDNVGGRYGGQMVAYDMFVEIQKARVSPNFDFGNTFGYRPQKWSGLVNNYVHRDDLLELKEKVLEREGKRAKNYNLSMTFYNKHGHGKNCLIGLTISRRQTKPNPVISFYMRSSEVTKRLLMDFLLVQRIGEFIFNNNNFSLYMLATNIYQNPEAFTMFDSYMPIGKLLNTKEEDFDVWQKKVMEILTRFRSCELEEVKMKVHKRCVRQLQRPNGYPLSGDRPMLAKDLKIDI